MKFNKRGQLTVFIIIGIVLLFSTALIIFIRQSVIRYKPPVEVTEQVVAELQPLQKFVTDCIEFTAKQAVQKAGMQGGYVDSSNLYVNEENPTSGDGILMSPGSNIKIPYWYYMKSPNSCSAQCEFTSKQPLLNRGTFRGNTVEEQIDKYVREKLSSCLNGFRDFKQQGFDIKEGQITARTTITVTDVYVEADYPLTVTSNGKVNSMSKFVIKLPVAFGKLYETAGDFTRKEIDTGSIGHLALNIIDSYSDVDENKLPPLADTHFGGSTRKWILSNIKNKVEDLLMNYVQGLQATGTAGFQGNYYQGSDPLARGLYSLFILPMNKTYDSVVQFDYLRWWPMYLKVTPSQGELIMPESSGGFDAILSFFNIQRYEFDYDYSFPVLITLFDPSAYGGEGYTFQFALEVNWRKNEPLSADVDLSGVASMPTTSLVCNELSFNSGNITVNVIDSITKEPLDGAAVMMSFGKEGCQLGETVNGQLSTKMPVGLGSLVVTKDDYMSSVTPFATVLDQEKTITVELGRYVSLNLSVVRIPVFKSSDPFGSVFTSGTDSSSTYWHLGDNVPDLDPTEQVIISFSRIQDASGQEEYGIAANLEGTKRTTPVRLVPGKYDITATLIDNQVTTIPSTTFCYPDDFWSDIGLTEGQCTTIDPVVFDQFPKGGMTLSGFTINSSDLDKAKEIVIYLFAAPDGYTRAPNGATNLRIQDLEVSGQTGNFSANYHDSIIPRFIK